MNRALPPLLLCCAACNQPVAELLPRPDHCGALLDGRELGCPTQERSDAGGRHAIVASLATSEVYLSLNVQWADDHLPVGELDAAELMARASVWVLGPDGAYAGCGLGACTGSVSLEAVDNRTFTGTIELDMEEPTTHRPSRLTVSLVP